MCAASTSWERKSGRVINLASIPALTLGLFRWPSPSASVQKVPVDSQEGGGGGPSWLYDFLVSAGKLTHWCDISSEAWPKSRRQRELWCWTTYVTGSELWKLLPGVQTFALDKQKCAHEKVPYWNQSLRSVVVFFSPRLKWPIIAYQSIDSWILEYLAICLQLPEKKLCRVLASRYNWCFVRSSTPLERDKSRWSQHQPVSVSPVMSQRAIFLNFVFLCTLSERWSEKEFEHMLAESIDDCRHVCFISLSYKFFCLLTVEQCLEWHWEKTRYSQKNGTQTQPGTPWCVFWRHKNKSLFHVLP